MSLSDQIRNDLKDAMRAKDQERLSAVRLLMAALKDEEGAKRQRALDKVIKETGRELREIPTDELPPEEPLTDAEMLQVVSREIKKRQDSAESYTKAGRSELAAPETAAIAILRAYLPAQMDPEEARAHVAEIAAEVGAGQKLGPSDMKRVMPVVMARLKDRVDGRTLNQLVREVLNG
jgi:uncharacterized protein YqeY